MSSEENLQTLKNSLKENKNIKPHEMIKLIDITDFDEAMELLGGLESEDLDEAFKEALHVTKETIFLLKQAEVAIVEHRHDDFTDILEMVMERNPELDEVKAMLADSYAIVGHPNKSIWLWEELSCQEPGNNDYSMRLALAYFRRKWLRKAAKQFEHTLELDAGNATAWERLIDCHACTYEYEKAKQTCFTAIEKLQERGIEDIRLYANAFVFSHDDTPDTSYKYLESMIIAAKTSEHLPASFRHSLISLLNYSYQNDVYDSLPYLREMANLLDDPDDFAFEQLKIIEMNQAIETLDDGYPELFKALFRRLIYMDYDFYEEDDYDDEYDDIFGMDMDSHFTFGADGDDEGEDGQYSEYFGDDVYYDGDDGDGDDVYYGDDDDYFNGQDEIALVSLECSILNDLDNYRPFLTRLAAEHPDLFGLHANFFNDAISRDKSGISALLRSRESELSKHGYEPKYIRADGSKDTKGWHDGTYRREGPKIGRNDPCPCGSGKKYKKCCGA